VHLDEVVLVGDRPVDDEEHEVVVLVDLRPLAELLRNVRALLKTAVPDGSAAGRT